MNQNHDFCGSPEWQAVVRDEIIPWALGDERLGGDVLEVGPGFGATTEVFRAQVPALTAVEIDPVLADALRTRFAEDDTVTIIEGDATALPFEAGRFSGAVCFSMLHHVPDAARQDRLLAEVARVLQPGGLLVASDSLHSPSLEEYHEGDTYVPIDPAGLADRLAGAGFEAITVRTNEFGWAAQARSTASTKG